MQRADVREVEERKLARPVIVVGIGGHFFLQRGSETLAHLGGGGFGEGDDEQFVERCAFAFEAVEAAGDERPGLAGARAGHDEEIAASRHGCLLRFRQRIFFFARQFHACGNFSLRRTRKKHRFVAE